MEQTTILQQNESYVDENILEPYVAPVLFSLVVVIGIIGNGLLIITVVTHSAMCSVSNIFLLSLAIGDLLVILVVTPLRMMLYIIHVWKCGAFFCMIYEFLIDLSQGVSIFTLTALAGDRFVAIVFPMMALGWSTRKKTIIVSILLWILATIFALPGIVTSRLKEIFIENPNGGSVRITYCSLYGIFNTTDISYHPYVLSHRVFSLVVYYAVPLFIITIMYVSIAISLTKSSSRSAREVLSSTANVNLKKQMTARRHIAKMVLVIVLLFFICWTPRHLFIFYFSYFSPPVQYEDFRIYTFVHFIFPILNSCVNPPALYFMNTEFRRYFNHYLFGWCCKSKRIQPKHRPSDGAITASTQQSKGYIFQE